MKKTRKASIVLFTLFSILIVFSCMKNNLKPSIKFISPSNNLIIEQDTVLPIIVDANDLDGDIKKVEILIDGIIVKEFNSRPYKYLWKGSKLENEGVHIIKGQQV